MLVKDIMTQPVKTVGPATSVAEVVSLMCLYRYSGLPVIENGQLVGMIAEKDVLQYLLPDMGELMNSASVDFTDLLSGYANVVNLKVRDLMTVGVVTVPPDMQVLKAAAVMASKRFRRIPVAEGGRLAGMLSIGDVHKAIFHANLSSILNAA